jgi:phytoene dehydrogenase-like protein
MTAPRPVIVGGGHNGLVAAFYLARAGLRPLVLERRNRIGGAAITREIAPGFRAPALAHACGPVAPQVMADMQLAAPGLRLVRPAVSSLTPTIEGRALVIERDHARTAAHLARWSARDAERYPAFMETLGAIAALAADLLQDVPPDIDTPRPQELWRLLRVGRRFRALGRAQAMRALRWGPMAVADVLEDWFETDVLRATLATRGVFGTFLGPRSAGTMAGLLLEAARQPEAPLAPVFVAGGPGALTAALATAAKAAGAEIRCDAAVERIEATDAGVHGVVLAGGETIAASTVVSNADPQRTLLGMIDPAWLEPSFRRRVTGYRAHGTVAKVNLAVDRLPAFTALRDLPDGMGPDQALGGRILIAPGIDDLERAYDSAKYGEWSAHPWLECVIPTMVDPDFAPPGQHVLSIYAQYVPHRLRGHAWDDARGHVLQAVVETLMAYAPGLRASIVAAEILTPADLEREHGLTGGHIHHGEQALDQLYLMRPTLGWARYRTPIRGLYLCGAGTHPGGGLTGLNGALAARVILGDLDS